MLTNFAELMRLANAYSESQALLAANDLGIFTIIGKGRRTAPEIARRCGVDPEGVGQLLNALVSLGLLTVSRGRYANTPLSRRHLDRRSPLAITNLLWLLGHHWHNWSKLPQALRKGRPGWSASTTSARFKTRFSLAMHERSFILADPTVRSLRLPPNARRFLDLGGGPGSYAIALAKRYPWLRGVIVDQTVTVAKRLVKKSGFADRLTVKAGDIFKVALDRGYDAVICANVIHIFNERENQRLLRRARAALSPKGKLFIVEFFLDDHRAQPPKAAVFSLMMWLFTATGRCYSWREVESWLKKLGFAKFKRHRITSDIGILEATKLFPLLTH